MDSQRFKAVFFIIFLFFALILLLVYLFFRETVVLIVFCVSFAVAIVFGYLLYAGNDGKVNDSKTAPLKELLEYHKLKESLLLQKNDLQKQYLKRQVSEKQFKMQVNSIDKKIIMIDYKLQFFDSQLTRDKDLKRSIEFVQKKYFKQEIPEDLYNEMQIEFSKELAQLNSQNKNKENKKPEQKK